MTALGTEDHATGTTKFSNPVIRWIDFRLPIFTFMHHELHEYPTPRNLNYLWNFGSLAGIVLVIMIVTGIVLAMHYVPTFGGAFNSVEHIMRDVNYGWLIRYVHTTGASMFFAAVYIHIFRGFYYGSYKAPRELLWIAGIFILLLMMATAFFGYTLPWGQMSFWGATVIANLFSAIPIVGDSIVTWLLGGFGVGDATLNRFYALHYLLPFVIVAVVLLHLVALHRFGSNNPDGIDTKGSQDTLPFHPYYTVKDLFGLAVFLIVYGWFVFYEPSTLLNPDNSIPANPGVTPAEIVPEWYLLPFYAILVADCLLLVFAGGKPPQGTWLILSRFGAAYYFLHFLVVVVVLPLVGRFEKPLPLPFSISEPVLTQSGGKVEIRDIITGGT